MIAAIALFVATADNSKPQLPPPTGRYAVGQVSYHWVDHTRIDELTKRPREVMVYVWYPALKSDKPTAAYLRDFHAAQKLVSDADMKDEFRPADYKEIEANPPTTSTVVGARMPLGKAKFPLVIFSHGWGNTTQLYTTEMQDLASNGYIVAAVDHPGDTTFTSFGNGHIAVYAQAAQDASVKKAHTIIPYARARVEIMAQDNKFVLDQLVKAKAINGAPFKGRIDLNRIAAVGHSIGGLTSARTAQIDPLVKASVDQDSTDEIGSPFIVTRDKVPPCRQPFLFFVGPVSDIFSKSSLHPSDESLKRQKLTRDQYDAIIKKQQDVQHHLLSSIPGGAYRVLLVDLPDFTHRHFSDMPLLVADPATRRANLHDFRIAENYLFAFLDKTLNRKANTLLDKEPIPSVKIDVFPANK